MVRTGILTAVFAVVLSNLLPAQPQSQKNDAVSRWSFAYARTTTRLVTLAPPDMLSESHARELAWAVCPSTVTAVSFVADTSVSGGYSYDTTESVPQGSHCLLIDATSHNAMFYWERGAEPQLTKRVCVLGFPQAAEALTGRKVDSCYLIGGYGTGSVELIEYSHQSPKDALAALLVDNLDTPTAEGPQYWIAKFPAGETGWASNDGKFHPEQFQHLFTMIDDKPNGPTANVCFVGIEWDGPARAELMLYRPVGNELRPVLVNHDYAAAQVIARQ